MTHHQQDVPEKFHTLDESIAHARLHDQWFKVSRAVVGAGMVLGAFARLIYGREFNANDRWIGPLLGPLSFVWMMAFLHMFYVMVRIRLSRFTQIMCYVFYIGIGLVLGAFLVIDWLLKLGN